jgi:hypothetical protein
LISLYSSYGLYLWIGLVALTTILLIWLVTLQVQVGRVITHYRRLVRDVDRGNLQQVLDHHLELATQTSEEVAQLQQVTGTLYESVRRCLQRVSLVRFNPFHDVGGDQSFSLAILDDFADGVVFTTLYSRDGCRTYAKPVINGQSKYALSDEERQAIKQARSRPQARPADPPAEE